jgi:hypothetical protein
MSAPNNGSAAGELVSEPASEPPISEHAPTHPFFMKTSEKSMLSLLTQFFIFYQPPFGYLKIALIPSIQKSKCKLQRRERLPPKPTTSSNRRRNPSARRGKLLRQSGGLNENQKPTSRLRRRRRRSNYLLLAPKLTLSPRRPPTHR